jgi:hypothetical protein
MSTSKSVLTKKLKFAFVALLALLLFAAYPSSSVYAGKTKKAKYSIIKILSTPGGLPITIDGKVHGETTTEYREINLDPGLHTLVIGLPSGERWTREINLPAGRIKCVVLNYRPSPPPPKSPCPYPVNVSAAKEVKEGEIILYTTDVSYTGNEGLTYKWKVNPASARILSGIGSSTITVDSTGLGGQRVIATLVVDDGSGDPSCRQTAQAVTNITPYEKKAIVGSKFDECNSCSFDDQKARLDNVAVELQSDLSTRTYIIAYAGRTSPTGEADRLMIRARDYLIAQRGIDASRIVVVNGGFREEDSVEVWIVPRGAKSPEPTPTLQPGDATPAPAATRRRRGRG